MKTLFYYINRAVNYLCMALLPEVIVWNIKNMFPLLQPEGENNEEILYCSMPAHFLFFTVATAVQSNG